MRKLHDLPDLSQMNECELFSVIEQLPYATGLFDTELRYLYFNKAGESMSGVSSKEAVGKKPFDFFSPNLCDKFIPLICKARDEKCVVKDVLILNFGQGDIYLKVTYSPIYDDEANVTKIIGITEDVTELKHKSEMLIDQSRYAAMGEMIGMIAHQWRQPISTISMDANNMLVDIALGDFNTADAEKYANRIIEQTQHLSRTIDDFRNFFKPDKVISEVDIKETVENALSIVHYSLEKNNIELITSFETDKKVKAYPRELVQVFVNIINNSKDILVQNKQNNASINIRVHEDEKYINIEICDNGGGIDIDILPKIFDPYFSTKDEKIGTGLGLYMSKLIIEEHLNGTIEAYNSNEGACFNIKLLKDIQNKDKIL